MLQPATTSPTPPSGPFATPHTDAAASFPSNGASVLATDQAFSDLSVYVGQDSSFTMYADTFGVQSAADFIYGKPAIRVAFNGTPITQVLSWTPTFADVASSHDLAYTAGQDGGPLTGTQPVSP